MLQVNTLQFCRVSHLFAFLLISYYFIFKPQSSVRELLAQKAWPIHSSTS